MQLENKHPFFSQQGCRWNASVQMPGPLTGWGRPSVPITESGHGLCAPATHRVPCAPGWLPGWSWLQAASSRMCSSSNITNTKCAETVKCSRQLLWSGCTIQLDFHPIPRYHLMLAVLFFHEQGTNEDRMPTCQWWLQGLMCCLCRREQWSNSSTAMRGVHGDGRVENLSLLDPSEVQAVVTWQNLSTYDLEIYWRMRGWLAACTGKCMFLFSDMRWKKNTAVLSWDKTAKKKQANIFWAEQLWELWRWELHL